MHDHERQSTMKGLLRRMECSSHGGTLPEYLRVLTFCVCGAAVLDAYSKHFALHEVANGASASYAAIAQQAISDEEKSAKAQEVAATLANLAFK